MLPSSFFTARRTISFLVLTFLLATSLLWVWHVVRMHEDGTTAMQSCLLAGGRVMLCALDAVEQMNLWHAMYAVVLPLAAVSLILVLALWESGASVRWRVRHVFSMGRSRFLARCRDWISLEPLRQAFSQGILHPKLYGPAQS